MKFSNSTLVAFASIMSSVTALSPAEWRSQSIYQIVTDRFAQTDGSSPVCKTEDQLYCGGTWQGIINKLDYIQNMGHTAVWISPIVKNLVGNSADGSAYHGYWTQDINSLNDNFGTEEDLLALSAALHERGMYLMVDVVTNHMAWLGTTDSVDYSVLKPFNSKSYYHDKCYVNYNDPSTIQKCWVGDDIVALPDLRTEDPAVLSVWESWITDLVAKYSIDGIRLDTAQQVDNAFLPAFQSAAGVYVVGEVFNGDPAYVCPYQNFVTGLMNFPAAFWITEAFNSSNGNMAKLANGIPTIQSACADTTLMGSFIENHDTARFPSITQDLSLAKNAIGFSMLQDGIPITYYGQEQHYAGTTTPNNREALWLSSYSTTAPLYPFIASVNAIRSAAASKDDSYVTTKANVAYSDRSTIVMKKGDDGFQTVSVFSNLGAGGQSYTLTLTAEETGFSAGQALVEAIGCTAHTTDSSGDLAVAMTGGLPQVFYPAALLAGSSVCKGLTGGSGPGNPTTTATNPAPSSSSTKIPSITTTSKASSSSTACSSASTVSVTFNEKVTTTYGETIKISGNIPALGNWDTTGAVALSASQYTSTNPLWSVVLNLAPGTVVQYKYIRASSSGIVTWEKDPNHSFTVPACGAPVVSDSWQA